MSWQGKYLEAGSIVQRYQEVVFKSDVRVAYLLILCPDLTLFCTAVGDLGTRLRTY